MSRIEAALELQSQASFVPFGSRAIGQSNLGSIIYSSVHVTVAQKRVKGGLTNACWRTDFDEQTVRETFINIGVCMPVVQAYKRQS